MLPDKGFEACLRAVSFFLGGLGIAWVTLVLPQFWSAAPANDLTGRILANDRFSSQMLNDVLTAKRTAPLLERSDLARADALIRSEIAEQGLARENSQDAGTSAVAALHNVKSALALNPSDSILWLMAYSISVTRNGFDGQQVALLNMSYSTAPIDGWIALRRNALALAVFSALEAVDQSKVVSEFVALVDSDFIDVAERNLVSVGWSIRERLVPSLERADIVSREALAKKLRREGVLVSVPGVELDERLWRQ